MKITAFLAAGALALASFAALAQSAAPTVVVAAPPDAVWWSEIANQAITAATGVLTIAIAALAPLAFNYIRNKSKLAAVFLSQALFDKLVVGINAQINAEAERLKQRLPDGSVSPAMKQEIAARAQPKIEEAFKDTLKHFDKAPGSQAVTDMILGRVDQALAKPVPTNVTVNNSAPNPVAYRG